MVLSEYFQIYIIISNILYNIDVYSILYKCMYSAASVLNDDFLTTKIKI